ERIGEPPAQRGIRAGRLRRVASGLFGPCSEPASADGAPAAIAARLVDQDAVEPAGQVGILAKPVEAPVRLVKGLLGDVLRGSRVPANQSPPPAPPSNLVGS